MNSRTNLVAAGVAVAVVALGAVVYIVYGIPAQERGAAGALVEDFGAELRNVSLLDPNASSTVATVYGEYVAPALLSAWQKDPEKAPGRLTSSPWPASIEIASIEKQGAGYMVNGSVILMTSAEEGTSENAGETPVVIFVVKEAGDWRIVAYEEQRSE